MQDGKSSGERLSADPKPRKSDKKKNKDTVAPDVVLQTKKTEGENKAKEPVIQPEAQPADVDITLSPAAPSTTTDRDPFHRNLVDTTIQEDTVPIRPSANLEREMNYSKNEEINSLVDDIRSGAWETNERARVLEEKYGKGNLQKFRAWRAGENDLDYNPGEGKFDYNAKQEVARRVTDLTINAGTTALVAGAVAAIFGGPISIAAIGGAIGARALVQAYRGFSGTERGLREDLEIARVRYYQKAKELADRVPPFTPPDTLEIGQYAEYYRERNNAIESLVNFVYASEQNGVVFKRDEDGRKFVRSRATGKPLESGIEDGDARPGGRAGPALVSGTEVYQPSPVAPTKDTIDDLDKKFEAHRRKWDWIESGAAILGSLGAGIHAVLAEKARVAAELGAKLADGQAANLDLDGDGIAHYVSQTNETFRQVHNISQEFVFHYNSGAEALQASQQGAQVLNGAAYHGSHIINESLGSINSAIDAESVKAATSVAESAAKTFGAIFVHSMAQGAMNEVRHSDHLRDRAGFMKESEILRRRYQPDSELARLDSAAMEARKPMPAAGQEWILQVQDDRWRRLKIEAVEAAQDRVILHVISYDPDGGDSERWRIYADDLIYGKSTCVVKEKSKKDKTSKADGDGNADEVLADNPPNKKKNKLDLEQQLDGDDDDKEIDGDTTIEADKNEEEEEDKKGKQGDERHKGRVPELLSKGSEWHLKDGLSSTRLEAIPLFKVNVDNKIKYTPKPRKKMVINPSDNVTVDMFSVDRDGRFSKYYGQIRFMLNGDNNRLYAINISEFMKIMQPGDDNADLDYVEGWLKAEFSSSDEEQRKSGGGKEDKKNDGNDNSSGQGGKGGIEDAFDENIPLKKEENKDGKHESAGLELKEVGRDIEDGIALGLMREFVEGRNGRVVKADIPNLKTFSDLNYRKSLLGYHDSKIRLTHPTTHLTYSLVSMDGTADSDSVMLKNDSSGRIQGADVLSLEGMDWEYEQHEPYLTVKDKDKEIKLGDVGIVRKSNEKRKQKITKITFEKNESGQDAVTLKVEVEDNSDISNTVTLNGDDLELWLMNWETI